MTFIRSAFICGALAGFGAFASAKAADLGGYRGSIKDDVPALVSLSAARFYARIDGSYASYDAPAITEDHQFDLINRSIGNNWALGGGIGYYFNKNIRADITYERRFEADVEGGLPVGSTLPGTRKFGLTSDLVLLNAYYDFDVRGRFTPYVGAGIGWVSHETKAGTVSNDCGCTGTIDKGEGNDIAAALMAGVAVNLTNRGAPAGSGEGHGEAARNFYLDIGYRFLYLGEAATGPVRANVTTPAPATIVSADPTVSDIHAHEFRVGLRYDFR
jgi:opacity protein-like surface antigen